MSAKHTPGPWFASMWTDNGVLIRAGSNQGHNLAEVWHGTVDEIEANARLIAAAPDGLAAAKEALAWMWNPDENQLDQYERIADEYFIDTGHLRPGKSDPFRDSNDPENQARWEKWRTDRSRRVRDALAAFIAKAEGKVP